MSFVALSATENSPDEVKAQQALTITHHPTIEVTPKASQRQPKKRFQQKQLLQIQTKAAQKIVLKVLTSILQPFQPSNFELGHKQQIFPLQFPILVLSAIFNDDFQREAKIYHPKSIIVSGMIKRIFPSIDCNLKPSFSDRDSEALLKLCPELEHMMVTEDSRIRLKCISLKLKFGVKFSQDWVATLEEALRSILVNSARKSSMFVDDTEETAVQIAKMLRRFQLVSTLIVMKRRRPKSPKKSPKRARAKLNHLRGGQKMPPKKEILSCGYERRKCAKMDKRCYPSAW